jgi:hypothetical protein
MDNNCPGCHHLEYKDGSLIEHTCGKDHKAMPMGFYGICSNKVGEYFILGLDKHNKLVIIKDGDLPTETFKPIPIDKNKCQCTASIVNVNTEGPPICTGCGNELEPIKISPMSDFEKAIDEVATKEINRRNEGCF